MNEYWRCPSFGRHTPERNPRPTESPARKLKEFGMEHATRLLKEAGKWEDGRYRQSTDYDYTTLVAPKKENMAPKNLLGARIKRVEKANENSFGLS